LGLSFFVLQSAFFPRPPAISRQEMYKYYQFFLAGGYPAKQGSQSASEYDQTLAISHIPATNH
jgi:hypothetical protein